MSKLICVGSKLPFGLILEHPIDAAKTVLLKGTSSNLIRELDHAITEIDAEFWDAWKMANTKFHPFVTGAIFDAKDQASVKAKAAELSSVKTGLEPMEQSATGISPDAR